MPCGDYPTSHQYRYDIEVLNKEVRQYKKMLCEACTLLEQRIVGNDIIAIVSLDLGLWWNQHKEEDKRRIAAEKAANERETKKRKALSKLTKAERQILGL